MTHHRPVWIVTDSTADLPSSLLEGLPIRIVPLIIDVGGRSYFDQVDITSERVAALLRAKQLLRTSQPSVGAFQAVYEPLLREGFDIVSIHIAAQLSGTWNAARLAAQQAPDRIAVIDGQTVSIGTGWLVFEAAHLAVQGASQATIVETIERRKRDVRVFAMLDTLEYLYRGGRIGRASAFLGTALQVKPILTVREGVVEPVERVRTTRRAIERLVELATEHGPFDHLAVLHLDALALAESLRDRLLALYPDQTIPLSNLGPVVGTYTGPGTLGFAGLKKTG